MSQRSAMNKRVQNKEYAGISKKSASSAKPARPAGDSVRVVPASSKAKRAQIERGESLAGMTKEEKREAKQLRRAMQDRITVATNYLMNQNELYKSRRKIWWGLLALGLVAISIAFILLAVEDPATADVPRQYLNVAVIAISYIAIIIALIYDYMRIRPIRNEIQRSVEGMSHKKIDDILAKAAAEQDAKRLKKEARRQQRNK